MIAPHKDAVFGSMGESYVRKEPKPSEQIRAEVAISATEAAAVGSVVLPYCRTIAAVVSRWIPTGATLIDHSVRC